MLNVNELDRDSLHYKKFYEEEAKWKRFSKSKREITLNEVILNEIKKIKKNILEIGFGDGFLANLLGKKDYNITGIDVSTLRTKIASKRARNSKFIVADANYLVFKNNTFDGVVCVETLEHVKNFEKTIKQIHSILIDEGMFLGTVPFRDKPKKIMCPYCLKIFHPYGHINFFDMNTLKKNLEKNGFVLKKIYLFGTRLAYNRITCTFPFGKPIRRLIDSFVREINNKYCKYILFLAQKRTINSDPDF
jgi:ubiquinone/menaquinone biosynthesis C-methylase UbiE